MGNIVWYYDPIANKFPSFAPSLVPGGTVLMLGNLLDQKGGASTLREVDLAGNTPRETNVDAVNPELAAPGLPSISRLQPRRPRLPNGDTAVLASSSRTVKIKGKRISTEATWSSFSTRTSRSRGRGIRSAG